MDIIRFLHSGVRWLVVIAAIVALVYMAFGLLQKRSWDGRAHRVLAVFSMLVGTQWVIGLVMMVSLGTQTGFGIRHFWEHLVLQTVALVVAHAHYMYRRREMSDGNRYRNGLIVVVATLVIVVVGIAVLPAGIQWRVYTGA
jgi:multisubunit Na+/H+ antiporter MnhB subunit